MVSLDQKRAQSRKSTVKRYKFQFGMHSCNKSHRNKARKGITIDFNEGGPINCVEQLSTSGKYTTYLGFVSGEILADLYSVHKTRLLEMNVRVFLQQRGGVNKGIRNTINNEQTCFVHTTMGLQSMLKTLN